MCPTSAVQGPSRNDRRETELLCEWFLSALALLRLGSPEERVPLPTRRQRRCQWLRWTRSSWRGRGVFWGRWGNTVSAAQSLGFLLARYGDGSLLWESLG